jgi:phosphoribosylamine--glycine ligase
MESDIVPIMLAAIEGSLDRMTIDWAPEDAVCVVMASGGYPGSYEKGKTITGVEQANSMEGVKVFHAGSAFEDGKIVTAGGRVLGVTAKAMGIEQATKMAYGAVELIKFHQAHYRTDIAAKAINRA